LKPINFGVPTTGQSKKLMTREKIKGPNVKKKKPNIQGEMNR
jgi:hypothetical protein